MTLLTKSSQRRWAAAVDAAVASPCESGSTSAKTQHNQVQNLDVAERKKDQPQQPYYSSSSSGDQQENSQPKPTKTALVTKDFNKIEEKTKVKCKIVSDSYLKYLCPYNHFGKLAGNKSKVTKIADRSSVASS